jgi:hypothetical protein
MCCSKRTTNDLKMNKYFIMNGKKSLRNKAAKRRDWRDATTYSRAGTQDYSIWSNGNCHH